MILVPAMRKMLAIRKAAARWAAEPTWGGQGRYLADPDYVECVKDILEHPVFQSMDRYIQHGSTSCKAHCIQVSYLSYSLCRRFGWDYRKAARAGLLHDLFLYDWHTHAKETGDHFHGFTHPRAALVNAKRYFTLSPAEEDIILCHMWPLTVVPPRSMAGMTVMYTDKVCSVTETALGLRGWLAGRFFLKVLAAAPLRVKTH